LRLLETKSLHHRAKTNLRKFHSLLKWKKESTRKPGIRTYVALSHCWGQPTEEQKGRYCTTKENYKARLKGFSIDDLPQTFQDAVRVARAIGLSYLWIDAVCIIQEDQEDWGKESLSMEKVFSSAYCTISADAAESWTQGFLQRTSPPRFTGAYQIGGDGMYACDTRHDFEDHVINSKLNRRAWVLQERVLSRRILHFAEDHTYFACGEEVRCEDFATLTMYDPIINVYPSFANQYQPATNRILHT
jgi:hypothetical protein